jgi:drug/metabolite transporter (DMT)-like permease
LEVALGLISALCWGITDLLGGPAARRVGVRHAVFATNAVGLLVLIVVLAFAQEARQKLLAVSAQGIFAALAAATLLLCATVTLSIALKSGKAAIVAPIAMSYGVVTTILSMLGGEHIRGAQLIGIAICIIGVPLTGMASASETSSGPPDHKPALSVALAVAAMLCFGASYWVQGRFAIKAIGTVGSLAINYALASCVLGVGFVLFKSRGAGPPPLRYTIVVAQASFSLLALAAFSWGLAIGHTATLAVLSTLSGAVTALLGFAFRGEVLNRIQWVGVATVVLGAGVVRL